MKPTTFEAVLALVGGGISSTIDGEIYYHDGQTPPTEEAIKAKLEELELAEPMRIMREQRDQLLKESDVYMFDDYPTSKLAEWKTYRQQLRDMPENETPLLQPDGSLSNVTWPTKPE